MRRAGVLMLTGVVLAATLVGCAAPYDGDGEVALVGSLSEGAAPDADAMPVVVDTDLGGDDLVALAFLLRHPRVRVEAITIAATGLVGCDPGVDLVGDLFTALEEEPVPVACGRADAGPTALHLPSEWRELAATGTGMPRSSGTFAAVAQSAPELIADLAGHTDGLVVVALGPMTNLADLAAASPAGYAKLAGIHAMAGSVDGPAVDGVAEWNVAADPRAFAAVLAAAAPLTVVPEDAIPDGKPDALSAPVVGAVAAAVDYPKWWDLATVAALVTDGATVETGRWVSEASEPGDCAAPVPGRCVLCARWTPGSWRRSTRGCSRQSDSGGVARPPPRAADREHDARGLDAGEQDPAVGAEGRTGELAVVELVARQRVGLALLGDTDQVAEPSPSSARMTPPYGDTVMLSGPSKPPSAAGSGFTPKIVLRVTVSFGS